MNSKIIILNVFIADVEINEQKSHSFIPYEPKLIFLPLKISNLASEIYIHRQWQDN